MGGGRRPLARQVRRQAQAWLLEEPLRLHREQEVFRTLAQRSDAAADVRISINALLVEVPLEEAGLLREVLNEFGAEPAAMSDGTPHGGAVQLRAGADANELLRRLAGAARFERDSTGRWFQNRRRPAIDPLHRESDSTGW